MSAFIIMEGIDRSEKIIAQYQDGMLACTEFFRLAREAGYDASEIFKEFWEDSLTRICFSRGMRTITLIRIVENGVNICSSWGISPHWRGKLY